MRHEITVDGHALRLRPVDESDTEFIIGLRTDARLNKFIHRTSADPGAHLAWLAEYYERPGDYYFIVERLAGNRREGAVGIYNLDTAARSAEWGRWVIRPGSLAAVESAWLIYRTAFERLGLDLAWCNTMAENRKVIAFHDSCGCEREPTTERDTGFVRHTMTRQAWQVQAPMLGEKARRIAHALGS